MSKKVDCLSQFFANNIGEESILLEEVNKFISSFDLLITYNGESFDIPLSNMNLNL